MRIWGRRGTQETGLCPSCAASPADHSWLCSMPELLHHGSATGLPSLSLLTACRVLAMVLRGVCLMRPSEISWMYRGGVAHLSPSGEWLHSAGVLCGLDEVSWRLLGAWLLCSQQMKYCPWGSSGRALKHFCLQPGSTVRLSWDVVCGRCQETLLRYYPPEKSARDWLSACMVGWSLMHAGAGQQKPPSVYAGWFDGYLSHLPEGDRTDPVAGYFKLLQSEDAKVREAAAAAWFRYEMSVGVRSQNVLVSRASCA